MPALSQVDEYEIAAAYKDAACKMAALPGRIKDELQQAEAEGRKPIIPQPLSGLRGELIVYAIDQIKNPSPELSSIMGVQRRACSLHRKSVPLLLSEQLKAILEAAGFGKQEEANAQV